MTDYFALLKEPRRPWLDPEVLKQRFLEMSTRVHPDRVHNLGEIERAAAQEKYVELNTAFNFLRDPRERLRHLLQLELGAPPGDIKQIPGELMNLFMEVGQHCRAADSLIANGAGVSSPLLKVRLFERSQACMDEILKVQQQLKAKRESLIESLRGIDSKWDAVVLEAPAKADALSQLEEMLHLFGFYDRWIVQLQERITRLSF